ncbi:uncharacterized protein LOC110983038 [Acanthaster planci]|uniref:Uncharacterized protein LOC110983038 n=1 Tax=Acanthaster planci TaxID=133434 RepID=A0A8B7YWA1_ACAPL|nr:uncharacterized protein LOC110983038 [Acanthaster planci]
MPSRSPQAYRDGREEDGWIRPYDPHRDVGAWSVRPHAGRGEENYGFERDYEPHYDQYYNRPYYISRNDGEIKPHRETSRHSYPGRQVPIPKSNNDRRSFIYWALALFSILAVLLLIALVIFVIVYVIQLEGDNSTASTVAPTQPPGVTTESPPGAMVNVSMRLMQPFLPGYNDPSSPEYMQLKATFTAAMDNLFLTSDLRGTYIGANINSFSPGSVDVGTTLLFTDTVLSLAPTADPNNDTPLETRIGIKIADTITTAVDNGACCQGLAINSSTVQVMQVTIEILPTSAPSVQPTVPLSTSTPTLQPTPSPPTPTPTLQPTPSSPTPTPTLQPTPSPTPTRTLQSTTSPPTPTPTLQPTPSPTRTPTLQPTPSPPTPTPTLQPTPSPPTSTPTVQPVTMSTTTTMRASITPVPDPVTTTQVAITTEDVPLTTTVDIPLTSKMVMTTASYESTTAEASTPRPSVLNPPECGISSQAPPSPPNATARGTWPWVGSFRYRDGHKCGVTLLSHDWALTSVSCVGDGGSFRSVVFGDITSTYSQSDVHIEREIARVYPHPGFNPITYDNDVAFLKMTQSVEYSQDVGPVCLQRDAQPAVSYSNCYVAGWGTLNNTNQDNLQTASASSISDGPCPETYPFLDLTDKFICAQFPNVDVCVSDLASGLVCQNNMTRVWSLIGIADSASNDCRKATFLKISNYWEEALSIVYGTPQYQCESVQVPQCISALSYSSTYPTTQSTVTEVMNSAQSSGLLNCHSLVSTVLCTSLLPECKANGTGLTLCRQTCEEVSTACATLFNQLSFSLECKLYPTGLTHASGLCESGEDYFCGNRSISLPAVFDYVTISSPNHPNAYPNYADCIWIITAPQDGYVVIKFLSLQIESCCDTLTIGEGTDVENRTTIHQQVFGSAQPLPMVIPSSVVWMRFQSDRSVQHAGFEAEVQAIGNTGLASFCSDPSSYRCFDGSFCIPYRWRCDDHQDCVLNKDESCRVIYQEFVLGVDGYQQITSPYYNTRGYPNYARLTYVTKTLPGRKLLINWDGFQTEDGLDFLEIGDGRDPDNKSTLFFRWSGKVLPPVLLSDGNEMWIQFTSDSSLNDRGFDLALFDVDGSESFDCSSNQFHCGHSVCIPDSWQCDGTANCANNSDEAGCVSLTATGRITFLVEFTSELENQTSSDYLDLRNRFRDAMGTALRFGLSEEYIYISTTVNSFRSSDDPTLRAANTPNTVVDFTVQLTNFPPGNSTNATKQAILSVLSSEVSNGTLGDIPVNASTVEIFQVSDGSTTVSTTEPPTCTNEQFECGSGQCIPQTSVCDQAVDCMDSTDEAVGQLCPVACGPSTINVSAQGSVRLTVPTFLPDLPAVTYQRCGYIISAPANYRIQLIMHKVVLHSVFQTLILTFGEGKMIQYSGSLDQPLDVISQYNLMSIALFGYIWRDNYGIDFEFRATNETDIRVCDNGLQVLPAERVCDQRHDCLDYTDEIGCQPQCGQSNYTLTYNVSVLLQLTNYPTNYVNGTACLWLITGPDHASIIFQTSVVDLANSDTLSIGQGHNFTAPLTTITVIPGVLPTGSHVLVPGNRAWVLFVSNSAETRTGFSINMRVLNDGDFLRCENLVQAFFAEDVCDGTAVCQGHPTDEVNCDACLPIPVTNCSNLLPYSTTHYPNRFAENAASAMAQYQQAKASFCQPQSELVICSLLFPECPESVSSRQAVCRSVCEAAVNGCGFNDGICDSLPNTGGDLWCNYENDIFETGICGTAPAGPNPFSRIIGGQDASPGEWPWMLAILDADYDFRCGASLINNRWAITAAHCADAVNSLLIGVLNLSNLGPNYKLVTVSEIIVHSFYDPNNDYNYENDIALLKLETPVEFNDYIRPVCLNNVQNETEKYQKCYATGWGTTVEGRTVLPDILQEVVVPLVPLENCTTALEDSFLITEKMICAGYEEGGRDSCQGDSGGPLVCEGDDGRWLLVGATSFGEGCARPGLPGVYVRISQYIDFIQFHVNQDVPTPGKVIG